MTSIQRALFFVDWKNAKHPRKALANKKGENCYLALLHFLSRPAFKLLWLTPFAVWLINHFSERF
jgi:hypothetical protein